MKEILLTQDQFAIVDDEDYDFIAQWNWYALKQPNTFYAVRDVRINGKKKNIWMHRLINKTPENLFTDHVNGNGLDNRKSNLRAVTHQENMVNCALWNPGVYSKYRGVTWHKRNQKWQAQITFNYKNIYIGQFNTETEAKLAFDEKRKELRTNQIMRE